MTLDAPASAAACSRPSAGVTPTSSLVAATASFRSIAASMVSSASSDEDGAADGAADGGAFGGNGATRFGTLRLRQLCIETSARCPYRTDHVRRVADGKHRNSSLWQPADATILLARSSLARPLSHCTTILLTHCATSHISVVIFVSLRHHPTVASSGGSPPCAATTSSIVGIAQKLPGLPPCPSSRQSIRATFDGCFSHHRLGTHLIASS